MTKTVVLIHAAWLTPLGWELPAARETAQS